MGRKRGRGKDPVVGTKKEHIISNEARDKQLIDEWLKKNKPSVQFKDEKMPHITPEPTLGNNMGYYGVFI